MSRPKQGRSAKKDNRFSDVPVHRRRSSFFLTEEPGSVPAGTGQPRRGAVAGGRLRDEEKLQRHRHHDESEDLANDDVPVHALSFWLARLGRKQIPVGQLHAGPGVPLFAVAEVQQVGQHPLLRRRLLVGRNASSIQMFRSHGNRRKANRRTGGTGKRDHLGQWVRCLSQRCVLDRILYMQSNCTASESAVGGDRPCASRGRSGAPSTIR